MPDNRENLVHGLDRQLHWVIEAEVAWGDVDI
jgi:hypothetical protein